MPEERLQLEPGDREVSIDCHRLRIRQHLMMEERKTDIGEILDAKQKFLEDMEEPTKSDGETVCFSVEELDSLEDREKQRNKNTTKIHQRPNLVGYLYVKPETVSKIHSGEELCVSSDLYTHRRKRQPYSSPDTSLNKVVRSPSRQCRKQRTLASSSPAEDPPSTDQHDKSSKTVASKSDLPTIAHTCSECGDRFTEHSLFLKHQAIHVEDRNLVVKYDSNMSSTKHQGVQTNEHTGSRLRQRKHVIYTSSAVTERKVQTEPKSFICKECGKSFTQNASLIVHKRTHTGERPHTCKICLKSFISGSYLVMHHRVHTGERPYVCNDCGKRFISSSNLIIHQRVHTGEKPYLCTECGKCFGHSSHLVRHQKVHTGERPFTCAECGKAFSRSSHLVRHQTIHMRSLANSTV
ncbi:PREDICTED: zinc finger protein with KRAB and SCAN domains 7-like [Nanorana parkeri]|uniref:zinc finger protein with KRAB and SCAN domains 7-like n=1 Tax=Nanorana parkeri TaxID=125878 RepID=UPI0008550B41|nr:PREDICTED: zinc finger protein with KRAB and SCAN domains 7-like [Nanorana parkeri]